MLAGVALPLDRLSAVQLIRHGLTRRVYDRLGVLEVQFLSRDADRLLPVLLDGEVLIVRWGNRRGESGESASLPCSLWTQLATVEAGGWAAANVVEVVIPASLSLDSGLSVPIADQHQRIKARSAACGRPPAIDGGQTKPDPPRRDWSGLSVGIRRATAHRFTPDSFTFPESSTGDIYFFRSLELLSVKLGIQPTEA